MTAPPASGASPADRPDRTASEATTAERGVADTSYLLPFGIGEGRRLLRDLHPGAALAPESVRGELQRMAGDNRDRLKSSAASALLSRRATPIQYRNIADADHEYRDRLLDELHQMAVDKGKASGPRRPGSTANRGEADCLCLCNGTAMALHCNDNDARLLAARQGVRTVSTAEDLRRLLDRGYTANELAGHARRMQSLEIGAVVSGPGYFRRPARRPRDARPSPGAARPGG